MATTATRMTPTAADRSPIAAYLDALLERHVHLVGGEVASYIPELAAVDPDQFGICLTTVDGAVYEAGDTRAGFTIQSMSKPLTYGLALERWGEQVVRSRVGVEPSGDAFNEISLAPATGAPLNPMINAGAIACAGLVAGDDPFATIVETYSRYAGRPLVLDEAVYRSRARRGIATVRSFICCGTSGLYRETPSTPSTSTSVNARSRSTAVTWRESRRPWPTVVSIRSPASGR